MSDYKYYKNTTIPEYESVTGSKLIFSYDKIYIYELNQHAYEKYLSTIFPISEPIFKYGGGSELFFGDYKLVIELSPENNKIGISYVHSEGYIVNKDEENETIQTINDYFVSATVSSNPNTIIDWIKSISGGIESNAMDVMKYNPYLWEGSPYYISYYVCPECGRMLLYKMRARGAETIFNNNRLDIFNIFTCPDCKRFYASTPHQPLDQYALVSKTYTENEYKQKLFDTLSFSNG